MADQQTPSTAIPIRVVLVDTAGNIIGSLPVTIADNGDFALGSVADAAWVSGNGTAIALLKKIASGGGGGSGPVTVIDGGDVAEGATTDAAVTTDANGTVSGKLRGIVKLLGSTLTIQFTAPQHTILDSQAAGLALDASLSTIDTDIKAQAKLTDTQPVSVASLPLPSGAATEATLEDLDVDVEAINTTLTQLVQNAAPQPWFVFGQGAFFATGN